MSSTAGTRSPIVRQVLQELSAHAALDEERLDPTARSVIADEDLIDAAAHRT